MPGVAQGIKKNRFLREKYLAYVTPGPWVYSKNVSPFGPTVCFGYREQNI